MGKKYIKIKVNRPIVNKPLADETQHMKEEIKWITTDLSQMPNCAEKIILALLQHLLQLKINGSVYLSKNEEIEDLNKELKFQIKKQELNSQSVSQILLEIETKVDIFDLISSLRKLLKEIRQLNIREIVRLVEKAADGNNLISDQDIVLFIGETGSGKSTTIQFLAGCKMGEKRVKVAENAFIDHHIEAISLPPNNPSLNGVISSCLNQSETRYIKPVRVSLKDVIGQQESGYLNLCDAPGFGDTAGPEVDIANSVGIINAIKLCKSVKVVASLSSKSGNKGEGYLRLACFLENLIKDVQENRGSIMYLFTKYPSDFNANCDLINLKISLERSQTYLETDSGFMIVINDMIEKTEKKTFIVNPIDGDPKKILKSIKKMEGIKYPNEYLNYAFSQDSRNVIRSQLYRDQVNIACSLKNKDSQLALFYLNNFKTLKDLIGKEFIDEAYANAKSLISENLLNFIKETKAKFNKYLHSQDRLQQVDILEYKSAMDYIRNSQMFADHFDLGLISSNLLKENINFELEKIKKSLNSQSSSKGEYLSNPSFLIYIDNILAISSLLPEFETVYKAESQEIFNNVDLLFEEIQGFVVKHDLNEFSKKTLILYNSLSAFKTHEITQKIKEKYIASIEFLFLDLNKFSEDPIFYKQKITRKMIHKLEKYLEKLKAAKETPGVQENMVYYRKLIENDPAESSGKIKDLNSLFTEFFNKVNEYFNNIFTKIKRLLQERGDAGLTEVEKLIVDMDVIRVIPEIGSITAKKYYETVDDICVHAKETAERLIDYLYHNAEEIKWAVVIPSLKNLENNLKWITSLSPETYETVMPKISEGLEQLLKQAKENLRKLDISSKHPENLKKAFSFYENIKPIKNLEKLFPKLRNGRKEISKKLYGSIQNSIDEFQKYFNLQNERFYQLNLDVNNASQLKKDAEFEKELLISKESSKNDGFLKEVQKLEENIKDYQNSIQTMHDQLFKLSQERAEYDFSIKLNNERAIFATKALEYLEFCRNLGDKYLKSDINDAHDLLIGYIKEYGLNLDKELKEKFFKAIKYNSLNEPGSYFSDLEAKVSDLLSLKNFSKIFEIIEGNDKINNWNRAFLNFYRDLKLNLEASYCNKKFEDLSKYLDLSKTLIFLDSFLQENSLKFENLYTTYKRLLFEETRNVFKRVLECLANQNFTNANEELIQIYEKFLKPKAFNEIKFDLETVLKNLMKDTVSKVRALEYSIQKHALTNLVNDINDNIENAVKALSQYPLMEFLDHKTKADLLNFKNVINTNFSNILMRAFKSIEDYLDVDRYAKAESGLYNISSIVTALTQVIPSDEVKSKLQELHHRIEKIGEEIMKKNYSDIKTYIYDPPKQILMKLKKLSKKSHKFKKPYIWLNESVRSSVMLAIKQLKNLPFEQSSDQIREIKYALNWVPEELREELTVQLLEIEGKIHLDDKIDLGYLSIICEECQQSVDGLCSCDNSVNFFFKDSVETDTKIKGEQKIKRLPTIKQKINQKLIPIIENLNKTKLEIISRYKELTRIIQIITKSKLSNLVKYIDWCTNELNSTEFETEIDLRDYKNIQLKEADLESFVKIAQNNLFIYNDDNEIVDLELEKILKKTKSKSLKFSKHLQEIKMQLKSDFNLLLEGHTDYVSSVAVTSDNNYIVSCSGDKTIRIWNLLKKRQETVLQGHSSGVYSLAVTSDNNFIVSGSGDSTVRIWNLLERKQETVLQGHESDVFSVAVTSDNKYIVSGSGDSTISIWNLLEKRQETVLQGHSKSVYSVAVSKDNNYIISGSGDNSLRVWTFLERSQVTVLQGHESDVYSVAVTSNNEYIISGSGDNTIRIWNFEKKIQETVLQGHTDSVYNLAVTSDNNYIISSSGDNTIRVWNLIKKRQESLLKGHTDFVRSVAVNTDNNYIISGSGDNTIRLWNILEKTQETVLEGHTDFVTTIVVTTDNNYIVSGSEDNTIRIWNLWEKRQESILQGHSSRINNLAVTCDNKFIVSSSCDNTMRIWNFSEKREIEVLNFENKISSLEVDSGFDLTIYFDNGQKHEINLKSLI